MSQSRRRQFLIASGALLAAPLARAQSAGRVYRVALVFQSAPVSDMTGAEPVHPLARAFIQGLRDLGYVEGRNLVLERRSLDGNLQRAAEVVAEVLRLKPDVIVSASPGITRAAKDATVSVPIVMAGNSAPVEAGLVASLGRPGGNVTGLTFDAGAEIEGKRLQLLKEVAPGVSRVAFVGSESNWESAGRKHIRATAHTLGLNLFLAASKGNDFAPAFATVNRERADAMFAATETGTFHNRRHIIEFAAESRRPASYGHRESVLDGGLMSYGMKATEVYRGAATYVDKILKGARPGDLPVEQGTQFELLVNLKTAKAIRLTIPPSVLIRADRVIE